MRFFIRPFQYTFSSLFFLFFFAGLSQAQMLSIQKQQEGILVTENGTKVLFFQKETKSLNGKYPRANYIHPLYGFNEEVLTEDFPEDHLHQRGIFWTWHQIRLNGQMVADGWECRDINWDVKKVKTKISPEGVQLQTKVTWKTPLAPGESIKKPIVKEKALIDIHPLANGLRIIDFSIDLKALRENFQIGGSEDAKGYSGFSLRVRLPEDIRFFSDGAELTPQTLGIAAGPWMDMQASFSKADAKPLGMALFCHPDFPAAEQLWILRSKRSMQNPAFPGAKLLSIEKGKTLQLKYRLVLYEGERSTEKLEKLYQEFIR